MGFLLRLTDRFGIRIMFILIEKATTSMADTTTTTITTSLALILTTKITVITTNITMLMMSLAATMIKTKTNLRMIMAMDTIKIMRMTTIF